jgi:hypothetical protein
MNRKATGRVLWGAGIMVGACFLTRITTLAVTVAWDVDPGSSYVRLTVPDQAVNVTNIGSVTIRFRDATSDSQWTDAGGRRAAVDGTVVTDYADGTSIRFLGGSNNLFALEQTNLRPNPAQWDPVTLSYTNTGTAPAALGARVRGSYLFTTFDVAFLAMRQVHLDIASQTVPLTSGSFAGNQTSFGISSAKGDVDGLELPLGFGQPVPDVLGGELDPVVATNSSGGTIENLGGSNRKLTYTINTPVAIQLEDITLSGTVTGQIVAYGTLPQAPTLRIARLGNGDLLLGWPASATGFVLQQNPALGTTNWTAVTNPVVIVGDERQVTVAPAPGGAFFRLRSQ